jgi:hypothetical protein
MAPNRARHGFYTVLAANSAARVRVGFKKRHDRMFASCLLYLSITDIARRERWVAAEGLMNAGKRAGAVEQYRPFFTVMS